MNVEQVQSCCDAMVAAMMDRGLSRPEVTAAVKSNGSPWVLASWVCAQEKREHKHFGGDGMAECLRLAEAWVAALPSRDETVRGNILRMAADLADYGAENGVGTDFLAPIIAEMQRMSGNALPAAVV